jgi:Mn2+/Fe2+ NRAMP family transporter
MSKTPKHSNNSELMRYASLGTQIFVSLGIAVFAGYKIDQWLKISLPLMVWLLPFIVLCTMIYKLIKETSKKGKGNDPTKV